MVLPLKMLFKEWIISQGPTGKQHLRLPGQRCGRSSFGQGRPPWDGDLRMPLITMSHAVKARRPGGDKKGGPWVCRIFCLVLSCLGLLLVSRCFVFFWIGCWFDLTNLDLLGMTVIFSQTP